MRKIVFLWENFGPYHIDRLNAAADYFSAKAEVIGVEFSNRSLTYDWQQERGSAFKRITLQTDGPHFFERSKFWQTLTLIKHVLPIGRANFFFCHYEQPAVFFTAILLRLLGRPVFIMNDMKFADFKRHLPREALKVIFHKPYSGGIAAGRRSADYFRFMGLPERKIHLGYGAVSIARLDHAVATHPIPAFLDRPFIVVARFMPMKNISRILDAYHEYRHDHDAPRQLHLCGSGPLEQELGEKVRKLGLEKHVIFRGFLQSDDVTRAIASSVCLILFSTQETFGNVIIEALALGVPVIASPICGATDEFFKSGVNGYLVEPDNILGLANLMRLVEQDELRWMRMSDAGRAMRPAIDIINFADAIGQCVMENLRPLSQEHT